MKAQRFVYAAYVKTAGVTSNTPVLEQMEVKKSTKRTITLADRYASVGFLKFVSIEHVSDTPWEAWEKLILSLYKLIGDYHMKISEVELLIEQAHEEQNKV